LHTRGGFLFAQAVLARVMVEAGAWFFTAGRDRRQAAGKKQAAL